MRLRIAPTLALLLILFACSAESGRLAFEPESSGACDCMWQIVDEEIFDPPLVPASAYNQTRAGSVLLNRSADTLAFSYPNYGGSRSEMRLMLLTRPSESGRDVLLQSDPRPSAQPPDFEATAYFEATAMVNDPAGALVLYRWSEGAVDDASMYRVQALVVSFEGEASAPTTLATGQPLAVLEIEGQRWVTWSHEGRTWMQSFTASLQPASAPEDLGPALQIATIASLPDSGIAVMGERTSDRALVLYHRSPEGARVEQVLESGSEALMGLQLRAYEGGYLACWSTREQSRCREGSGNGVPRGESFISPSSSLVADACGLSFLEQNLVEVTDSYDGFAGYRLDMTRHVEGLEGQTTPVAWTWPNEQVATFESDDGAFHILHREPRVDGNLGEFRLTLRTLRCQEPREVADCSRARELACSEWSRCCPDELMSCALMRRIGSYSGSGGGCNLPDLFCPPQQSEQCLTRLEVDGVVCGTTPSGDISTVRLPASCILPGAPAPE